MKIKRTVAPSVREAMKKVRQEQGPDAVILANRKITGGVEIISATDYDESAFDVPAEPEPRLRQTVSRKPVPEPILESIPEPIPEPIPESIPEPIREPIPEPVPKAVSKAIPQPEPPTDIDSDPPMDLSYQSIVRAMEESAREDQSLQSSAASVQKMPARELTLEVDIESPREPTPQRAEKPTPQVAEIPPPEPVAKPVAVRAAEPTIANRPKPQVSEPVTEESTGSAAQPVAPMVDISATPAAHKPLATGSYETDSTSWQQGQLIHDLQRELHSLRGLMQNQLSVLEWDALAKRNPVQFDLLSRLSEMGIGTDIARALVNDLTPCSDPEKMWRLALGQLASRMPIADDDLLDNGGIVALVGPTGVGKTTSAAKIAARFVMRHGQRSVGLISTDGYRIGAHEQLQHYARILGVPFKTAQNQEELGRALGGFFDKKLVLIDTAGMSQRDIRLSEQISTLRDSFSVIRTYLVLAANTQLGALDESAKGFGRADLSACIITKLDETTSVGAAITVAMRHHLPIAYLGVGQRVPEDLQPARAHRLVSRAVPMADRYGEQIDPDTLAVRFGRGVAHAGV